MKRIFIKLIKVYKSFSSVLWQSRLLGFVPTNCKFYPTCSEFTIKEIERAGVIRGTASGLKRILACNFLKK